MKLTLYSTNGGFLCKPHTIHSEVAQCLMLPSLPVSCGASDLGSGYLTTRLLELPGLWTDLKLKLRLVELLICFVKLTFHIWILGMRQIQFRMTIWSPWNFMHKFSNTTLQHLSMLPLVNKVFSFLLFILSDAPNKWKTKGIEPMHDSSFWYM